MHTIVEILDFILLLPFRILWFVLSKPQLWPVLVVLAGVAYFLGWLHF